MTHRSAARLETVGMIFAAVILAAGAFAIGALSLEASLALPDITTRAVALARW